MLRGFQAKNDAAGVPREGSAQGGFHTSHIGTIPANLYLFLRRIEFSGVGEDLDETAGNASEKAAW